MLLFFFNSMLFFCGYGHNLFQYGSLLGLFIGCFMSGTIIRVYQ